MTVVNDFKGPVRREAKKIAIVKEIIYEFAVSSGSRLKDVKDLIALRISNTVEGEVANLSRKADLRVG